MSLIINSELKRRPRINIDFLSKLNINPILKYIYANRGINSEKELNNSTHNLLSYNKLINIKKAVKLLAKAIFENKKITVVGDFDVDGATSIAIAILALKKMGVTKINFLIPNRFEDGYGLSIKIVEKVLLNDSKFIITVDNGISSHEAVSFAKKKGISVLITDHHIPGNSLPDADAIINPNLLTCSFNSKFLSGSGVVFYLMIALRAYLKKIKWFKNKKIIFPKLANFLDLVAFGTIADVVPLDFNNRIIVYQGLKRMQSYLCRPGIKALAEISGCNLSNLSSHDLSFKLGPRLNSIGRLYDMSLGVKLLLTNNLYKARKLVKKLEIFNKKRKNIENEMKSKALFICNNKIYKEKKIPYGFVIYQPNWHQGVLGLVASKIKDHFNKPVIVFTDSGNNFLKGSGRSINGLNIFNLIKIIDNLNPGLILKFGGHYKAIGLTLKEENFNFFCKIFIKNVKKSLNISEKKNIIWSDGELNIKDLSINMAKLLRDSGPWGNKFPYPVFDGQFFVLSQKLIGNKHIKFILQSIYGGPILDGIAFDIDINLLPNKKIYSANIAYNLEINEFYGSCNLQLLIRYIYPLKKLKNIDNFKKFL